MTRHDWFQRDEDARCFSCGDPECLGRLAVDYCPIWQAAKVRNDRGEYLTIEPLGSPERTGRAVHR